MYEGSGGAFGFFRGRRASHASNAGRYPGRKRFTAEDFEELDVLRRVGRFRGIERDRIQRANLGGLNLRERLALVRVEEAFASEIDDSVPHLAAE